MRTKSWPAIQPLDSVRGGQYFCCGNRCGCCPAYILVTLPLAVVSYVLGAILVALLCLLAMLAYLICGYWGCLACVWLKSWRLPPWKFPSSVYIQATYLTYQYLLFSRNKPTTGPEGMPVSSLRPKEKLEKTPIHYALKIQVPTTLQEEFTQESISPSPLVQYLKEHLSRLMPYQDNFAGFRPNEDPVRFVMQQLHTIYPQIYQVWEDKHSDNALTRFCLHGLGAHRVQTEDIDGKRHFVVRTNVLSALPMRPGYERYGGDAYFDEGWHPVKIVDTGLGPLKEDSEHAPVTTHPGDAGWERAKFRFRSSLSVLVTLVDHLFGAHLQGSNLFVTALREQLSAEHPVRRFMTPFTYQTISVNNNASNQLVQVRAMGPQCFGLTDTGLQLALAAAPKLLVLGLEVPEEEGGPFFDLVAYAEHQKQKGIDTEFFRQSAELYQIFRNFVEEYLAYYYPTHEAVVGDEELQAFFQQYNFQFEFLCSGELHMPHVTRRRRRAVGVEAEYKGIIDLLTSFMFLATGGHEQVGAVEPYVQDVSFCAFRWVPGARMGTKQGALNQALLMSFTSMPMPKLMGSDWTHLFPKISSAPPGAKTPEQAFQSFQEELAAMSKKCDAYNETAQERPFPHCFPVDIMNPKLLDSSIGV